MRFKDFFYMTVSLVVSFFFALVAVISFLDFWDIHVNPRVGVSIGSIPFFACFFWLKNKIIGFKFHCER